MKEKEKGPPAHSNYAGLMGLQEAFYNPFSNQVASQGQVDDTGAGNEEESTRVTKA